jgi:hypothetical protein
MLLALRAPSSECCFRAGGDDFKSYKNFTLKKTKKLVKGGGINLDNVEIVSLLKQRRRNFCMKLDS